MAHEHLLNQAIHGHVGTDPKVSTTTNGTTRATFRVGIARRVETAEGEWINAEPHYVTVAMYGKSAERTAAAIQKGDNIIALGAMREYEVTDPENGPRVLTEFRAGRVGPDLNLTEVAIARRGPAASAAAQATTPGAQTGTAAPARADTGAPEAEPKENPWVRPGPKASDASKIWAQAAQQAQAQPQVHQAGTDGIGI
ncbi:MAG TPA: single-stranded DNA-binding protein [Actinomycetales bacterium]|nr:single-stranded DNA-binding protein [Actinomycetales bacterium]